MSSLVGLLKVSLQSDTAEFSRGFDQAEGRLDRFGQSLSKLGPIAAGAATAIAATIGTFVAQTARAADEINKLSDRTGVSTEALSRLKYAAELSDVSITDLEGAFRGLSQRMLQAQEGTGAAARAFSALGVRTAEADGSLRKMDDVLLDVADAFAASSDTTAKAAIAQDLFGRAGIQLLPLLNQGSAGIRAMGDEAERFGLVFSQDAANAASEFQDNLTRLQGAANGLKFEIGNALIPALNNLIQEFFAARAAGLSLWEALTRIGLSDPTKSLQEQLDRVRRQMAGVIADIERQGASDAYRTAKLRELELLQKEATYYETLIGQRTRAAGAAKGEADSTDRLRSVMAALRAEQEQQARAADRERAARQAAARAAAEAARALQELQRERAREIASARDAIRNIDEQIRLQRESNEEIGLTAEQIAELRYQRAYHAAAMLEERANLIALLDPNSEIAALYREQADALRDLADAQREGALRNASADAARAAEQEWLNTARSIEQSLTDALMRAFEDGASFGEAFRRTLLNMFQTLVLRPIIQPIVAGGMSLLGMGNAAAAGQGLGVSGGGMGGMPSWFNPMSFLGGNSLGMGISNAATWLAGLNGISGSGFGNMLTGFAGNVAGISNVAFGLAGLGGGLGASLLFQGQGQSGLGGSIGSTIGLAVAGPIGAVVGTVLGGFLGSLIGGSSGERFPRTVGSAMGRYENGRYVPGGPDPDWFPNEDQFGGGMDRALNKLNKAFAQRLGALLDAFDIDAGIDVGTRVRLRRTSGRLIAELFGSIGGEAFTTGGDGNRLQFGEDANIQEAFAEFVEVAMTQGLAAAIKASPLADNIKAIFEEELSGDEINAAVDTLIGVATLKSRLEGMPAVFQKLASSIDEVLASDNYDDFADAAEGLGSLQAAVQVFYDGFTTGADKFRDAQRSLLWEFNDLGIKMPRSIEEFRRLADGMDLTTEEGRELFRQLMDLAPAFLTVAGAVEEVFAAISTTAAQTIDRFMLDTMTDRQKYAFYDQRIADILKELEGAFDPATIADLYNKANNDLLAAWNLLSDSEKQRLRNEFIDRALELEKLAQGRLSVEPLDIESTIRNQADAIGDAMERALTAALGPPAERMEGAAEQQRFAAERLSAAIETLPGRIVIEFGRSSEIQYA